MSISSPLNAENGLLITYGGSGEAPTIEPIGINDQDVNLILKSQGQGAVSTASGVNFGVGVSDPQISLAIGSNDIGLKQVGNELALHTSNTERMRIDSTGNVNIQNSISLQNYNILKLYGITWGQLGSDIDGEASVDYSGYSVSLNTDGSIVAIGAIYNDGNGGGSGHTRIYAFNGSTWSQIGSDIDGEAGNDYSGYSVSLSTDGTIVAIGARYNDGNGNASGHARIYQWRTFTQADSDASTYHYTSRTQDTNQTKSLIITEDTNTAPVVGNNYWTQIGSDIDGVAGGESGRSISLSTDGSIVAVGSMRNTGSLVTYGCVRVYQYSSNTWTQLGSDIDGEAPNDYSSISISLNADGTRIAIGADGNDGGGNSSGHVRVYDYDSQSDSWNIVGQDIDGETAGDGSGFSVSLSADGTRVAIGAPNNDGNGNNSGHTRIYEFDGSSWSQIGQDIDGEAEGDNSGHSVSISEDGLRVAIGATNNDGTDGIDSNRGHTRIYEFDGSSWSQIGQDIDGEAGGDGSGYSVSLSADGLRVAIGSPFNNNLTGHVRVYQYNAKLKLYEKLNVTNTGNIGITGATEPTIDLAIGENDTGINHSTSNTLAIYTSGTERMRVDSTGNVGIGTTSPKTNLSINGNFSFASENRFIGFNTYYSGGWKRISQGYAGVLKFDDSGQLFFANGGDGLADATYNPTTNTKFKIESGGDVRITNRLLIGDTDDTNSSRFMSALDSNLSGTKYIAFGRANSGGNQAELSYTYASSGSGDNRLSLGFHSLPTVLNVKFSGRVGINNTGPECPLHVSGSNEIYTIYRYFSYAYSVGGTGQSNRTVGIRTQQTAGILTGELWVNSDSRIKKDIIEINDDEALTKIRLLKPSKYKYVDEVKNGDDYVYGFIAQEVKEILPYAIEITSEYIPNVYQGGTVNANIITFSQPHGLTTNGNIKLLNGLSGLDIHAEYTILDDNRLTITDQTLNDDPVYDDEGNLLEHNVFVYGTKVGDFHTLKKDVIWSAGISALQEIDRQLQAEKEKTATLETKINTLETQIAELMTRVTALETS